MDRLLTFGSSFGRKALLALAAITPLLAVGAAPVQQVGIANGSLSDAVARLRPGQFLWLPELAPQGPLLIAVNLTAQKAIVYRNGVPIAVSTVSTGKAGKRTPAGIFTILQKKAWHRSNLYSNAPMPFMQRLTWTGIALHAGQLPGYPASHGCIRLPAAFARSLFDITELGMTVVVSQGDAVPLAAPALQLASAGGTVAETGDALEWRPERAPRGPVSILVSGADRRISVLRNGVEIGNAPVRFTGEVARTSAYTLQRSDARGMHWLQLRLPGQRGGLGPDEWNRFRVPAAFKRAMASVAGPGTTVIVTGDSLRRSAPARTATILEEEPVG